MSKKTDICARPIQYGTTKGDGPRPLGHYITNPNPTSHISHHLKNTLSYTVAKLLHLVLREVV